MTSLYQTHLPFSFQGKQLRTAVDHNTSVWFSSIDLLDILGVNESDRQATMKTLLPSMVMTAEFVSIETQPWINECGMAWLIFNSGFEYQSLLLNSIFKEIIYPLRKRIALIGDWSLSDGGLLA
jgi:prophage antirepressor-like protein